MLELLQSLLNILIMNMKRNVLDTLEVVVKNFQHLFFCDNLPWLLLPPTDLAFYFPSFISFANLPFCFHTRIVDAQFLRIGMVWSFFSSKLHFVIICSLVCP